MAGPSGSYPHHAQRPGHLKRAREETVVDPAVQFLGDLFYLGNDALPVRGIGGASWCQHSPGGRPQLPEPCIGAGGRRRSWAFAARTPCRL